MIGSLQAQQTPDVALERAVAKLITMQAFPKPQDVADTFQADLQVQPVTFQVDGQSITYAAKDNRWGLTSFSISDPRNPYRGLLINLSGVSCMTAQGIASAAGITLKQDQVMGAGGASSDVVLRGMVNANRAVVFPPSDDQCVRKLDINEDSHAGK
jgi:hypothetical protein